MSGTASRVRSISCWGCESDGGGGDAFEEEEADEDEADDDEVDENADTDDEGTSASSLDVIACNLYTLSSASLASGTITLWSRCDCRYWDDL